MRIRNPKESEFEKIYRFISKCKPLENYGAHFYRIIFRYTGNTCFIAEEENLIVGFAFGIASRMHKHLFFLWQIGISPSYQGKGAGSRLLKAVERKVFKMGFKRIELTVAPDNRPSRSLFEKNGYLIISGSERETLKVQGRQAVKDFYGKNRHFILYGKRFKQE